jgi:hypothetical protein
MSRPYQQSALVGAVLALSASLSYADVIEFDVVKVRIYEQSTQSPPVVPINHIFNTYLDSDAGDATAVTVNGVNLVEEYPGGWCLDDEYASQGEMDAVYPTPGVFTIALSGGTLGNLSEAVEIAAPSLYPAPAAFTASSFTAAQGADPTQDLLIEWNAPDSSADIIFFAIYDIADDNYLIDTDFDVSQTSYLLPASMLDFSKTYEIEVVFANLEFGEGTPAPGFGIDAFKLTGYASVTISQFTTASAKIDDLYAGVLKVVEYEQTANDTQPTSPVQWSFEGFIDAQAGDLTIGEVLGGTIPSPLFEYEPGSWDTDDQSMIFENKANLDVAFPSNTIYTMSIEGGSLGALSQQFPIGPDSYPLAPYLVATDYGDLQGLDPTQEFVLTWAVPAAEVDLIAISIERLDTGFSVIETILSTTDSQLVIPENTLEPDVEYKLLLTFVDAVAFNGDGAPGFDNNETLVAGYITDTTITFTPQLDLPCAGDITGDGMLNFFDISAFLIAFNTENPDADFTGDGMFDFFDVSAFLIAFNSGCP